MALGVLFAGAVAGHDVDRSANVSASSRSVPVVSAPVVSAPVVGAPVVGAPVVGAPVVGAPVVGAPVVSAPIDCTPIDRFAADAAPLARARLPDEPIGGDSRPITGRDGGLASHTVPEEGTASECAAVGDQDGGGGAEPSETQPEGAQPEGAQPEGAQPEGAQPEGAQPEGTNSTKGQGGRERASSDVEAGGQARQANSADEAASVTGEQLLAAVEQLVIRAVRKAELSVVAISRLPADASAQGFQVPSLGRLGPVGGEAAPMDPDFTPSDFATGVVIDRERHVVTAYHVIGNVAESQYFVWSRHRPFRARVLAADPWMDLAVLQVDEGELEPIALGNGDRAEIGQFVVALGNPQAVGRDGQASAAWGLVSNRLRRAPRGTDRGGDAGGRETLHHYGTLLQTDARLDVGFRGGALVDLRGEMIGLLTAYAGGARDARLAGFAIPVDDLFRRVVDQLRLGKVPEYGFLGVGPPPFPLDERLRQRGRHGVMVETVLGGSPAARAGIQIGDIITHAAGQQLYDDDDLFRVIGSLPPEHITRLTVFRGNLARGEGEVLQRDAKLSKKRVQARRPEVVTAPAPRWRGMLVDYASIALHENLSVAPWLPAEGCVYILDVAHDSAAWRGGLRRGMFVTQVGSQRVSSPREFLAAVDRAGESVVRLQVVGADGRTGVQAVSP